jgi:hypothetical protein
MNRILFLDFDGVLHPNHVTEEHCFVRIPVLERTLSAGACDIVISSSWRFHHSLDALRNRFPPQLRKRILGCTDDAVIGRHARYREIRAFLDLHGDREWRTLDDSAFEFPEGCKELILCDGAVGIAERQAEKIVCWLSRTERQTVG